MPAISHTNISRAHASPELRQEANFIGPSKISPSIRHPRKLSAEAFRQAPRTREIGETRGEGGGNSLADEGAAEEIDAVQLREHPRHHVRGRPQRRRRRRIAALLLPQRRRHGRSAHPGSWGGLAAAENLCPRSSPRSLDRPLSYEKRCLLCHRG